MSRQTETENKVMKQRGRPKGAIKSGKSGGDLGDLLRLHRSNLKLGLRAVAEACGCRVQYISNIETGRANLPVEHVESVAKVLKLDPTMVAVYALKNTDSFKRFSELYSFSIKGVTAKISGTDL